MTKSLEARRVASTFASLAVLGTTTPALACPTCAIDTVGPTTMAIGILVVVPFALTALIAAFVRRLPPPPGARARFER